MERLDFLALQNNNFTGEIPSGIFEAPNIRIVYLSDNQFQGPIPENFGDARLLKDLYLDGNQLTGTVPEVGVNQLQQLTELLLEDNQLTGQVPASICALREPVGVLRNLYADCGGDPPKIICTCCTRCFS